MIQFYIDEKKFERLLSKFKNNCGNDEIIFKCYKNKLELNCGYSQEIEDKIKKICDVAHKDEPDVPWWVELLD